MKNKNTKIIQSVDRAFNILEQFSIREKEIGLSDLSKRTGLKRTTCYGLAETLLALGYLGFNEENSKYRLGIKTLELGQIFSESLDLRKIARPFIQKLADKYEQTVHLVIPDKFDAVYIDKVGEKESFRVRSAIGTTAERFCTGVSKVLTASLSEEELNEAVSEPFKKFTDNTITDRELYREELKKVREHGFAVDNEELEIGLACVAAPVFDHRQKVIAAISMSGPTQLMKAHYDQVIEDIKDTARQISNQVGGQFSL